MKTPSLLLLAALAAAPASAADPAPRCDAPWLAAAAAAVAVPGGMPSDPDQRTVVADSRLKLKFGHEKLCEASAWRYLAAPAADKTLKWSDAGLGEAWSKGTVADQIHVLQAVNDLYGRVDALGRDAVDKADAALKGALDLGLIKTRPIVNVQAREIGAAFAADQYWTAEAAAPAGSIKADALAKGLAPLIVDVPVKGKEPTQAYGPAVQAFRAAVTAMAVEVAMRGSKRDFADKRQLPAGVKADFAPAPVLLWAIPPAPAGAPAAPPTDEVYQGALKFLAAPGQDAAALGRLDGGLRGLIAQRAAAVDAAYKSALKALDGRGVRAAVSAAERVEKGGPDLQKSKLALDVTKALGNSADYRDLDALYENKKGQAGWADSDEGKAVLARMESMRKDAAGAAGDGKQLKFSIGGQPFVMGDPRVADLDKDVAYRGQVAAHIASMIASFPADAKVLTALAAFRGDAVVSPATPAQQQAAVTVLPTKTDPPPPPAKSVWSEITDNTSSGFLGLGGGSTVQRYGEQRDAELTARADQDGSHRDAFELRKNDEWRRINDGYKRQEDAVRSKPRDPDLSAAARKVIVDKELADLDAKRKADQDAAETRLKKELDYRTAAETDAYLAAERAKLDAKIAAGLTAGIEQAVVQLQADYKVAGGERRRKAEKESGYAGEFYRTERVDLYFKDRWQGAPHDAAVQACRASLGFKEKALGQGASDPSAKNVDEKCGVHKGLVDYLASWRGKIDAAK